MFRPEGTGVLGLPETTGGTGDAGLLPALPRREQ